MGSSNQPRPRSSPAHAFCASCAFYAPQEFQAEYGGTAEWDAAAPYIPPAAKPSTSSTAVSSSLAKPNALKQARPGVVGAGRRVSSIGSVGSFGSFARGPCYECWRGVYATHGVDPCYEYGMQTALVIDNSDRTLCSGV